MHVRSLLAGAGLAVVVAAVPITVVSVASADDGGPSAPPAPTTSATCPPGHRWEIAGDVAAAVHGNSDLSGLADALAAAPTGTRAQAARQYLTAHPDARTALRQVRQEVRPLRACRAGG